MLADGSAPTRMIEKQTERNLFCMQTKAPDMDMGYPTKRILIFCFQDIPRRDL